MTPNLPEDPEGFDPAAELEALRVLKAKVYTAVRRATIGVAIVVIGTFVGFAATGYSIKQADDAAQDAQGAVDAINGETDARRAAFSETIDTFCDENNRQDRLLAQVLSVAVNETPPFGAGINPDNLSPFDLRVIATIARIQNLSVSGPPSPLQTKLEEQIRELKDLTPCEVLVKLYLAGQPIPGPDQLEKLIKSGKLEEVLGE